MKKISNELPQVEHKFLEVYSSLMAKSCVLRRYWVKKKKQKEDSNSKAKMQLQVGSASVVLVLQRCSCLQLHFTLAA